MDQIGSLFAFDLAADVQAAGLVIGAVAGARDFAVLASVAAARHPGFKIELAIRGATQIAGGRVDHAVGDSQAVKNLALEIAEMQVHRVALLGEREGEHLDFGELMHAVKAARRATCRPRLGTEAMAHPTHLERQLLSFQHFARIQPPKGNLRRGDEIEIEIFNRVNLCLGPARNKTDPLQNLAAGQVGRNRGDKAFADQKLYRILLEREFQKRPFILQKVKAVAGDPCSSFKIDQIMLLGECHVIEHGKAELADLGTTAANLAGVILTPNRRFGMRQVGHAAVDGPRFSTQTIHLELQLVLFLAKRAAFFLALFTFGIVLGSANRLAHDIGLPRKFLDLLLHLATFGLQPREALHVGFHATDVAVLLNQIGIFENESFIEHVATLPD